MLLFVLTKASLQRRHKIDHIVGPRRGRLFRRDPFALQLGVDYLPQPGFIAILQVGRCEFSLLSIDQLGGELHHLAVGTGIRYAIEQLGMVVEVARLMQRVQHHSTMASRSTT